MPWRFLSKSKVGLQFFFWALHQFTHSSHGHLGVPFPRQVLPAVQGFTIAQLQSPSHVPLACYACTLGTDSVMNIETSQCHLSGSTATRDWTYTKEMGESLRSGSFTMTRCWVHIIGCALKKIGFQQLYDNGFRMCLAEDNSTQEEMIVLQEFHQLGPGL